MHLRLCTPIRDRLLGALCETSHLNLINRLCAGGLEVTEAVAEQVCEAAKANASLGSMHQLLKVILGLPLTCQCLVLKSVH